MTPPILNSEVYRNLLTEVAKRENAGFVISAIDQGLPGIDTQDFVFTDLEKARHLGVALDQTNHPKIMTDALKQLFVKLEGVAGHTLEARRHAAVAKALDPTIVAEIKPILDADKLGLKGPYRDYFHHLLEIAKLEAQLHLRQTDARNDDHRIEIQKDGTPNMNRLFMRQMSINECGPFVSEVFCSSHPAFKAGDSNGLAWPDDMTDGEFAKLKERLTPDLYGAVMSNYTVVERDGETFTATPFVTYPLYQPFFEKIANEFEAISRLAIDEPSKKVAAAYAAACRGEGKNPLRPFDEAEEVWATHPAPILTFAFGAFEEDPALDHFGIKRGFQMVIYRVREELTAQTRKDRSLTRELNDVLRSRGLPIPATAEASDRTMHLADNVYSTCKLSDGHSMAIAQTVPNDGPVVNTFGRRVDVGVNVAEAHFDKVMLPIRDRIMIPEQRQYVQRDMMAKFAELHELAHSAGYLRDHTIVVDGKEVLISEAMGGIYYLLEEGKANAGAVVGISRLKDDNGTPLYSTQEVHAQYVTYVNNLVRQIRLAPDDTHTWGARAELGSLFKQGAVELVSAQGESGESRNFLSVNREKMDEAMSNFFYETVVAQASGSKQEAIKFIRQNFDKIPQELADWVSIDRTEKGRLNDVPITIIFEPVDFFAATP